MTKATLSSSASLLLPVRRYLLLILMVLAILWLIKQLRK